MDTRLSFCILYATGTAEPLCQISQQLLSHCRLHDEWKVGAKNKSKKAGNQEETEVIKKKKLTSRQRKALTKIIEKKQKSQKRTEMLKELKKFELSEASLTLMTSISQTQTNGLRNAMKEKKESKKNKVRENSEDEMSLDEEDVGSEVAENEIV